MNRREGENVGDKRGVSDEQFSPTSALGQESEERNAVTEHDAGVRKSMCVGLDAKLREKLPGMARKADHERSRLSAIKLKCVVPSADDYRAATEDSRRAADERGFGR